MKALVYTGPHTVTFQHLPEPAVEPGHVLVRVLSGGICGSDLIIFSGKHLRARAPLVMGHEIYGEVVEAGRGVSAQWTAGRKVAVNPLLYCGTCLACREQVPHLCHNLTLIGIDCDGAFSEYRSLPAANLLAADDMPNPRMGALVEPLAVAIHAVNRCGAKLGEKAVVIGGGAIGTLTALVLRHVGIDEIKVFEVNEHRIRRGRAMGLDMINARETDPVEHVAQWTEGRGADRVVEASGVMSQYALLPQLAKGHGTVLFLGVPKEFPAMNITASVYKELTYTATRVYEEQDLRTAIRMLSSEACRHFERVATGGFSLEDGAAAFAAAQDPTADQMKVLITPCA